MCGIKESGRCFVGRCFVEEETYVFQSEEELNDFLTEEFLCGSPFYLNFDEKALRLVYKRRLDGGMVFVRVGQDEEKLYDMRPGTDGGVLMVPKAQIDLFENNKLPT